MLLAPTADMMNIEEKKNCIRQDDIIVMEYWGKIRFTLTESKVIRSLHMKEYL